MQRFAVIVSVAICLASMGCGSDVGAQATPTKVIRYDTNGNRINSASSTFTVSEAPPPLGRYVFYPSGSTSLEGGRLLDTATGEMWVIGLSQRPDGKLGGQILMPITKQTALTAEELIRKYGGNDPLGIRDKK